MAQKQNSNECAIICWGIAALVGVLAMVMLYWMAEFSALQAIFSGGVIGFVLGVVLSVFICRGQTAAADLASDETKPAARYAAEAQARRTSPEAVRQAGTAGTDAGSAGSDPGSASASAAPAAAASASVSTPAASGSSAVKPSKVLPGQAELAARKGEWKYENDVIAAPADEIPGGVPAEADAAAPPATVSAKRAPVAKDGQPELMDTPRPEGADDLKKISGVGPKLEQTLNEMGIWHFDQVASWRKKEIAWVDSRLKFKGRIERDDWMSQAKILAKGGETEFSRKKKS